MSCMKRKWRWSEKMEWMRRVVVTGMGVISAIGKNVSEFSYSLKIGHSGIGYRNKTSEPSISANIGADIRNFSFESAIEQYSLIPGFPIELMERARQCSRRAPFALQCSVSAALEAWEQARLDKAEIDPQRMGIIVAGNNLTQNIQYQLHQKFQKAPEYLAPSYALQYMDTDQVGTLSEILGIHGEGFTVGGASASGNIGIIKACQLIKSGVVDVCVVIGPLTDLSPMELSGFYNLGVMGGKRFDDQPEKACRPFDRDHEGFIYGQASGCLIIESLELAQKRRIPVLAEILAGSLVLDGNRLADPSEDGEVRAMLSAIDQARIDVNSVDYLNTHGTSTPLGDETEIKAIRRIFNENLPRLWINSTKGLTGHCLSAAGVVECIATIIQMQAGFVHPNINLENPIDPECLFGKATSSQADIKIAMSNSFGFGGINTSIILKKEPLQDESRD
jgi:malonyl-ACP decarboxylase